MEARRSIFLNKDALSLYIWLLPALAALAGLVMLAHALLARGPELCITFTTSEGLQAGKTRLQYRSVEVGRLEELRLSRDRSHVTALVRLEASASVLSRCSTRFWVVRPRVEGASVSAIGTLVTGPYIAADMGKSPKTCQSFIGLEAPPAVSSELNGTQFVLHAPSLGSLEAGSPVYFRRVQVGRVLGYALQKDGGAVEVDVFVKAPFDRYVTSSSHWWRASGIDVRLNPGGVTLDTQSLTAILSGGVQFDQPDGVAGNAPANEGAGFSLAESRADAMASASGPAAAVRMRFGESLRGLGIGATVDFRGVAIGEVTRIDIDSDVSRGNFDSVVTVNIYPFRLGRRYRDALGQGDGSGGRALLRKMIAQGLRGQLRMGNVITGQRYIALDFFPHAPPVQVDMSHPPVELPTVPNAIEELQDQLTRIVTRLDRVPFDQIGHNLEASTGQANDLFVRVNDEIAPQAQSTLAAAQQSFAAARATLQQDSPLQSDVRLAVAQLRRTLASVNALTDYLEQHPESIVWGKSSQP
jgi:paraquat-inducible protein B